MKIKIASAGSVVSHNGYYNELIEWADFVKRFEQPQRTHETTEQYHNELAKGEQTTVKDKAGVFVGGWLSVNEEAQGLHRNLDNLLSRSILNLDFDDIAGKPEYNRLINVLQDIDYSYVLYSTHSHTPEAPRVRVLIPLSREVTPKEFEAVTRHICAKYDTWKKAVDTKSFKPAQAMFYATATSEGHYIFNHRDRQPLDPDTILKNIDQSAPDWYTYPKTPAELERPAQTTGNGQTTNPKEKPGVIGAFNRAYNVHDAIEQFIPDRYTQGKQGTYTWIEGTSADGVKVYNDYDTGDFIYSNHETDPASGQLLNAFDMVRVHLFGQHDQPGTTQPMNERESYKRMVELARNDDKVREILKSDEELYSFDFYDDAKDTGTVPQMKARAVIEQLDMTTATLKDIHKDHRKYLTDDEEKQLYLNGNASTDLNSFLKDIKTYKAPIKTGFEVFDRALDGGLHDGLYIWGAISSLGKTTMLLQQADHIAQRGQDVLFFSLEMSANEIKAKSISKLTFETVLSDGKAESNAKTVRGITDLMTRQNGYTDLYGAEYPPYTDYERELIEKSIMQYTDESKHLYIYEGQGSIGINEVKETVKMHKKYTGNTPVVFIDYLQILAPADPHATDKQNTDKAVLELKRLSRDYMTPVVAISSFNRENYKTAVSMASFKESGAVEYSSDVLIGLQFSKQREIDDHNRNKKQNEPIKVLDHDHEKSQHPRQIELKILKNRNGVTGVSIDYDYYAPYNAFKEKGLVDQREPLYKGELFEVKGKNRNIRDFL